MDPLTTLLYLKLALVAGLALWLTLIVVNNVTDRDTNVHLIARMMTMEELKQDPTSGNGLQWRAVTSARAHRLALLGVIAWQLVTVALLWRGTYLLASATLGVTEASLAVAAVNLAMIPFVALWFLFLCGGLWFGYWMKMGPVQQVHLTLLIVSLLTTLVVNVV